MLEPNWLKLIKSCLRTEGSNPSSRFMQLATVTLEGEASVRTVVFRGWHESKASAGEDANGDTKTVSLKVITDARSEKMPALKKHPWAEICWYFFEARQQFRFTGKVTIVDHKEKDQSLAAVRVAQWKELSDNSRLQFRYPPPGQLRKKTSEDSKLFAPEVPSVDTPEDTFVLLLMEPNVVDVVDLRANERRKFTIVSPEEWEEAYINP